MVVLGLVIASAMAWTNTPPHKAEAELNKQVVQETKAPDKSKVEPPQPVAPVKVEPQKPMSNREIGQQMAALKGWTGNQWLCLEKLWTNESNWNHQVANYQGSGAYGIPQSLPASKMASHGADYLTNPRTQIAWGLDYIAQRYKTPCGALSFWNAQYPHWY